MKSCLGLDFSTQSASALLLDLKTNQIIWEHSIPFHSLDHYQTQNGVFHGEKGEVTSPPLMWVEALELLMARLARDDHDVKSIAAISGAGQQHGTVYLNNSMHTIMSQLTPEKTLHEQFTTHFSKSRSPVWLDTSTGEQCETLNRMFPDMQISTGSPATLRFAGPQIMKFFMQDKESYHKTQRIHLVSSFIASLFLGRDAPIDHADASGMNMFDLRTLKWNPEILNAIAPNLEGKIAATAPSSQCLGSIAPFWVERFGFSKDTRIVAFSGDNPCTLIGLGISNPTEAAISLGTSDTFFGLCSQATVHSGSEGHLFRSPGEGFMHLLCFSNGSLAREKVRQQFNLNWESFESMVHATPPGCHGDLMLPYFCEEITPLTRHAQVYRYGIEEHDVEKNCRAIFEAQMLSMRSHSQNLCQPDTIHVTGGASQNKSLLEIMANVFSAEVKKLKTQAGAGFGAALRACQSILNLKWPELKGRFIRFEENTFHPNPVLGSLYNDLLPVYEACERHALKKGKSPESFRNQFKQRWK